MSKFNSLKLAASKILNIAIPIYYKICVLLLPETYFNPRFTVFPNCKPDK
jgi:hypothetical protein